MKKNILLSYLAFFASQSSNAGYQELTDFGNAFTGKISESFHQVGKIAEIACSGELAEQLGTYVEKIKEIVHEGKLGEKLAEAYEAEKRIISDAFMDTSRVNAITASCVGSYTTFNGTLGAITLASHGFAIPATLPLFFLGNFCLTIHSILTVAHDKEINTIAKGAGVGAAKGLMSGLFAGTVQGIAHFLPLVDGHSHGHVLNIAHTVQDHANPAVHPDNLAQEGMNGNIHKLEIIFQKEAPRDTTLFDHSVIKTPESTTINVEHFSSDHKLTVEGSGVNFKAEIVPQDDGNLLQITCNDPQPTGSIVARVDGDTLFGEDWIDSPLSLSSTDTVTFP